MHEWSNACIIPKFLQLSCLSSIYCIVYSDFILFCNAIFGERTPAISCPTAEGAIMFQLCNRLLVENSNWNLLPVVAMTDMSNCSTCWTPSLTCHTPTTALAMRIRRMTKGSTKAVTVSSPSSNQASTWGRSSKHQISEKQHAHMSPSLCKNVFWDDDKLRVAHIKG